jgi:predicted AAA+ superfamily ATPase
MSEYDFKKIEISLDQIAAALERLNPPPSQYPSFENHDAFVWNTAPDQLKPVIQVSRVELGLLVGIDRARDILLENTLKFSEGLSANNALLWGARGMGKSSLIKAVHQKIIDQGKSLKIVELQREDLASVSRLLDILRTSSQRFLLFCDDLSFSHDDQHYKSLKAVLDGGLEGRPENVLFYATSNRRHLMPRDMIENEKSSSINPSEAVEEKVSLSDRFGLWLGFHPCTQDEYLEMIARYCKAYELSLDFDFIKAQAIEWQATRGARSGRVAWQFFVDLAAKTNTNINN